MAIGADQTMTDNNNEKGTVWAQAVPGRKYEEEHKIIYSSNNKAHLITSKYCSSVYIDNDYWVDVYKPEVASHHIDAGDGQMDDNKAENGREAAGNIPPIFQIDVTDSEPDSSDTNSVEHHEGSDESDDEQYLKTARFIFRRDSNISETHFDLSSSTSDDSDGEADSFIDTFKCDQYHTDPLKLEEITELLINTIIDMAEQTDRAIMSLVWRRIIGHIFEEKDEFMFGSTYNTIRSWLGTSRDEVIQLKLMLQNGDNVLIDLAGYQPITAMAKCTGDSHFHKIQFDKLDTFTCTHQRRTVVMRIPGTEKFVLAPTLQFYGYQHSSTTEASTL